MGCPLCELWASANALITHRQATQVNGLSLCFVMIKYEILPISKFKAPLSVSYETSMLLQIYKFLPKEKHFFKKKRLCSQNS